MASNLGRTVQNASDAFYEYTCIACEKTGLNTEASFYCSNCKKLYCLVCRSQHDKFLDEHKVYGKENIHLWGTPKTPTEAYHTKGNIGYASTNAKIGKSGAGSKGVAGCRAPTEFLNKESLVEQKESNPHISTKKTDNEFLGKTDVPKTSVLTNSVDNSKTSTSKYYQLRPLPRVVRLPDQDNYGAYMVVASSRVNVKLKDDSDTLPCCIVGICHITDDNLAIIDNTNQNLKLLQLQNQTILASCAFPEPPWGVCKTTDCELAVTIGSWVDRFSKKTQNEIRFVDASNGKLKPTRVVQLSGLCYGIEYHQRCLYLNNDAAIFRCDINGKEIETIYKNFDGLTSPIARFLISDANGKIYVTDASHRVVTLNSSGKLLTQLCDSGDMRHPKGLCFAGNRTIFVCSWSSNRVVQANLSCTKILTKLVTSSDGIDNPWSCCFLRKTDQVIVGQNTNDLIVLDLKPKIDFPS